MDIEEGKLKTWLERNCPVLAHVPLPPKQTHCVSLPASCRHCELTSLSFLFFECFVQQHYSLALTQTLLHPHLPRPSRCHLLPVKGTKVALLCPSSSLLSGLFTTVCFLFTAVVWIFTTVCVLALTSFLFTTVCVHTLYYHMCLWLLTTECVRTNATVAWCLWLFTT